MEDVEGDRGLAVVHVVQLGGLGPLNEGGVEDGLPFEIVEGVDDVVGIVDLAQLEGRVGKPGETFRARLDSRGRTELARQELWPVCRRQFWSRL